MKYYRLSFQTVLWGISYTNIQMLQSVIPDYKSKVEDPKKEKTTGDDNTGFQEIFNTIE